MESTPANSLSAPPQAIGRRRPLRRWVAIVFAILLLGLGYLWSISSNSNDLDALRQRIAANGGSTSIIPTPFSLFVGTLLKTIGAGSNSGSVAALDKFVLNLPSGFRFTPEELEMLSQNRRVDGFVFQGGSEEIPLNRLERMTWLKTLVFDRMNLSESSLQTLPKFSALKTLAFRNIPIDQRTVNAINEIPNLEYLNFHNCQFDRALTSALSKSKRLTIVGVDKTGYTLDESKDWLNRIPKEIRFPASPSSSTPAPVQNDGAQPQNGG